MNKTLEINLESFIIRNRKRMDIHKFSIIFDKGYIYLFLKLNLLKYSIWSITLLDIYFLLFSNLKDITIHISISFLFIYILIYMMNRIYNIIRKKEEEADIILESMFLMVFDIKNIKVNDVLYMLDNIMLSNLNKLSKLSKEDIKLHLKTEIFKNSGALKNDDK